MRILLPHCCFTFIFCTFNQVEQMVYPPIFPIKHTHVVDLLVSIPYFVFTFTVFDQGEA